MIVNSIQCVTQRDGRPECAPVTERDGRQGDLTHVAGSCRHGGVTRRGLPRAAARRIFTRAETGSHARGEVSRARRGLARVGGLTRVWPRFSRYLHSRGRLGQAAAGPWVCGLAATVAGLRQPSDDSDRRQPPARHSPFDQRGS